MISKYTSSLKTYCLAVAWCHFLLLCVSFPLTMSIITLLSMPLTIFFMVFLLLEKIHKESGFTRTNFERMMCAFDPHTTTTPMALYLYAMDDPLDIDYDLFN